MIIKKIKQGMLAVVASSILTQAAVASTEETGDALQLVIPAAGFLATQITDDQDGAVAFGKSFLANVVLTHGLKHAIQKERPDGSDNLSFPSGHTSAAFHGAGFIHARYGITYAIPAYLGAAYVGYSRIEANKHDEADVLAGAALGVLTSFYFTDPVDDNVVIMPMMDKDTFGISLSARFK